MNRARHISTLYAKSRSMDNTTNITPTTIEPAVLAVSDLAPPKGQLDGSCAGIPLDAWRRGDPLDEVQTAVQFLVSHPDIQMMAYCHDVSREEWQAHDRRQMAAGKAWAAREYPHLSIRLRTATMPYRGVGNDVTVVFAEIVKPKKAAT